MKLDLKLFALLDCFLNARRRSIEALPSCSHLDHPRMGEVSTQLQAAMGQTTVKLHHLCTQLALVPGTGDYLMKTWDEHHKPAKINERERAGLEGIAKRKLARS